MWLCLFCSVPEGFEGYAPGNGVFCGPGSMIPGGNLLFADSKFKAAIPTCLRLFVQLIRLAASRAACTAGNSKPTSTPMIAMTTSSSTSVNPRFVNPNELFMSRPLFFLGVLFRRYLLE